MYNINNKYLYIHILHGRNMIMDTRILENFIVIAREQNISKAAKMLHISQPSLSRQMMNLEDDLGVILFEKSNRYTRLTDEGKRFKKRAEEIVELERKTRLEFKSNDQDVYGQINIGAGETEQFNYIAKATKIIKDRYPHIQFNFYSGNSEDIVDKLNNGLLEFGLLMEPVNTKHLYTLYLPESEPLGLLVYKNSPYYNHDCISAKELMHIPLIISRRSIIHEENSLIKGNSKNYNIVATCNLPYNGQFLVQNEVGCFLSIYKKHYDDLKDIRFIPMEKQFQRRWLIASKQVDGLSVAHKIFLETLKTIIDEK